MYVHYNPICKRRTLSHLTDYKNHGFHSEESGMDQNL